jgi:hypothetical protein
MKVRFTPEERRALSKAFSKAGKVGGTTAAANLTPKQRKEKASKAAQARWAKAKNSRTKQD